MMTETFYDTDPVRLGPDEMDDPFKAVEMFFCIMQVVEWRQCLKIWFKRALIRDYFEADVPGDLIFMYEQITKLIEAGYHISKNKLIYHPSRRFDKYTAREWLLICQDSQLKRGIHYSRQYVSSLLQMEDTDDPLKYIHGFFDSQTVAALRSGLNNWVHAALTNNPLWEVEDENIWEHYENLERIIEAFYLVITENAVDGIGDKQEISDEKSAIDQESAPINGTIFSNIQDDIQETFNQIMAIVPANKIFRVDHLSAGSKNGRREWVDLLVVVPPDCPTTFAKLEKQVRLAGIEDGRVSITFYSYGGLLVPIKKGELFYLLAFNHDNLIYDNGKRPLPDFPFVKFEEICQSASIEFQPIYQNALAFYEGAIHYQALGRLANSVFMLQQATELCFRGISWALLSVDKRTHSIRGLMKLNRRIAPQMNALFPCDSKEEDRLLQLLEDAYTDARYKKDYDIAEDDVLVLMARVGDLLEVTKQVFNEKLRRIAVMTEPRKILVS